jgi:hypothetical protein
VSFTMPENGTLTSLSAWCRNNCGANNILLGLYGDTAGWPGAKLVATSPIAENFGGVLALATGSASFSLVSGTKYWVVVANVASPANGGCHSSGISAGVGLLVYMQGDDLPSSNVWTSGTHGTDPEGALSAYATYTPSGGGGKAPPILPGGYRPQFRKPRRRYI